MTLHLSQGATSTAAILLLALVTIEYGGWFMLRVSSGRVPVTDFQRRFYRAGHAHAGVLVTLGLVTVLLTEATGLSGALAQVARSGVPFAAVLMSGGFFLAAGGAGRNTPRSAGLGVLALGAASLTAGVVTLGIALLRA